MKRILCLLTVCLCACSTHTKQAAVNTPVNDTFYPPDPTPPYSFPVLTVLDTHGNLVPTTVEDEQQRKYDEQQKYDESLTRIENEINKEGLTVQMHESMCKIYKDKFNDCKKYKAFLKKACSVDVLLDSRGDHHRKPYCTP